MDKREADAFREALDAATTVCFLTGAGVSTNSGIPDFQTLDANWPFEVSRAVATSRTYLHRQPDKFWAAYRYIFDLKAAAPNSFHRAVANLETQGKTVTVVTQNIDGLHTEAGSSEVLEVHGNARWLVCDRKSCKNRKPIGPFLAKDKLPRCEICRKFLRPDVVLFEEVPRHYPAAEKSAITADLLIVAGASLQVGPINRLPHERTWRRPDSPSAWFNRLVAPHGYKFSLSLHGDLNELAELLTSNP